MIQDIEFLLSISLASLYLICILLDRYFYWVNHIKLEREKQEEYVSDSDDSDVEDKETETNSSCSDALPLDITLDSSMPPPPPPPPPLPAGLANSLKLNLEKDLLPVTIHRKTKQFYWEEVPRLELKNTIFGKEQLWSKSKTMLDRVDTHELEEYFAVDDLRRNASFGNTPRGTPRAEEEKTFLPEKRSHVLSIQLKSIKMDRESLLRALKFYDSKFVTVDTIEQLISIIPVNEEINELRKVIEEFASSNFFQDRLNLKSDYEQFFYEFYQNYPQNIELLKSKLESWKYVLKFESEMAEFQQQLHYMTRAVEFLKHNTTLRTILQMVLIVGNLLNNSQKHKKLCEGFKASSLLKLKDSKSTSASKPNYSLLDFVRQNTSKLVDNDGSKFGFTTKDLMCLEKSALMDFFQFEQNVQQWNQRLEELKNTVKVSKEDRLFLKLICNNRKVKQMVSIVRNQIETQLFSVKSNLLELCLYYGESKSSYDANPCCIFLIFHTFIKSLDLPEIKEVACS